MMNPYFTPKTPKPRLGAFDIVLRGLMGLIAVVIVGVGIWITVDSLNAKTVAKNSAEPVGNEMSQTDAVTQLSGASH